MTATHVPAPAATDTTRIDPSTGGGHRRRNPNDRLRHRVLGRNPLGLLFSTPYLIFVIAVFAAPVVYAVWIAFHDFFFAAPGADVSYPFVGIANFVYAFSNAQVLQSFANVGIFLIINVPLTVVLSLLLASALNRVIHAKVFLRISFYVPYITASVALVGVWLFLFGGDGLVNNILGGAAPDPSWLVNEHLAMPLIAVYVTWKQLGFYILLYLAALQNVSKELYEQASTDGAGGFRQFMSVTVPGVRPATLLVLLVSTVTGANLFTEPYLLTGGGPNGSSNTPVYLMYQLGVEQGLPDVASAIGLVLVVAVLIIAYLQNRFAGGRNE